MTISGPRVRPVEAVVIGGSAGANRVLRQVLGGLTPQFPVPIVVVLHMHPDDGGLLVENLQRTCPLPVVEILDKMPSVPGRVHVAPPDYHVLMERRGTFALSLDEPVQYCRPAIDVTLTSASALLGAGLLAIILSGANEDGADGVTAARRAGARTIVQDPADAQFPVMPAAALARSGQERGLTAREIAAHLQGLERLVGHHG